jgi:hypothetical protein
MITLIILIILIFTLQISLNDNLDIHPSHDNLDIHLSNDNLGVHPSNIFK